MVRYLRKRATVPAQGGLCPHRGRSLTAVRGNSGGKIVFRLAFTAVRGLGCTGLRSGVLLGLTACSGDAGGIDPIAPRLEV